MQKWLHFFLSDKSKTVQILNYLYSHVWLCKLIMIKYKAYAFFIWRLNSQLIFQHVAISAERGS